MIKFDKNEFLEPMIYSTNDKYETMSRVSKEIIEDIKKLQEENDNLKKYCCKRNDCSGRIKENNKLTDSEVLTEFEKWLWGKLNIKPANKIYVGECLEKLQELKGDNK